MLKIAQNEDGNQPFSKQILQYIKFENSKCGLVIFYLLR